MWLCFFDYSDLKLSYEKRIKEDLWERRNLVLDPKYRQDKNKLEAFFRFIKLRLTYTENCLFIRLKLRTLLRNFGYKRRSVSLVNDIKRSMKELKLEAYLRDYQPCDIADIDLDDVIIIRLKPEKY